MIQLLERHAHFRVDWREAEANRVSRVLDDEDDTFEAAALVLNYLAFGHILEVSTDAS